MGENAAAEGERLLTIGAVARSFGVNENTVRRIEAAGLLKPVYVSEKSGYRYYDIANVSRLREILELRKFGFVYEDLREYYRSGRDMNVLYQKLLEKQFSLNAMVEEFSRRMGTGADTDCRPVEYPEAYCLCRETTLLPTAENLLRFAESCVYEAIRANERINYTRPVVILTEEGDLDGLRPAEPWHLTFCVTLLRSCPSPEQRCLPGGRALCRGWREPGRTGLEEPLEQLRRELRLRGLKQSGALRLCCGIGGPGGEGQENGGIDLLVPFA